MIELAKQLKVSSVHVTFATEAEHKLMTDDGLTPMGDFTTLPGRFPYMAMVPQWDFLSFLPAQAAPPASGFRLTTTRPGGPGFAPAFVGNGYLAGRSPA